MNQTALVLEGGAMRSIYAAGVLDILMENNIEFPYVIGSSAGNLIAANYVAKHIGRSARINILHSNDPNYFGIRHFIKSRGNIFNFNYLYHTPINDLYPYNVELLQETKQRFIITATNCITGMPIYFEKNKYNEMTEALTASCSLPIISKIVKIDGYQCLDGGISIPIAIDKAIIDGNMKIVVVLTRNVDFRKKENPLLLNLAFRAVYRKYPALVQRLIDLPSCYNQLLEKVITLENEGRIFVVRPSMPLNVSRTEQNARKLMSAYLMGRDDMKSSMSDMIEYIKTEVSNDLKIKNYDSSA